MSGYEVAEKYWCEREIHRIKTMRKYVEEDILELIRNTMPEIDVNDLKIEWSDSPHIQKLKLLQKLGLYKFKRQIKRDFKKAFKNERQNRDTI